jgi:hypothetical protein
MPAVIRNQRKLSNGLPVDFDSISDNPLQHGASYFALKTRTDFKNKVSLFADLYAEHRGVSYGLFNQKNTVLYPVIRLEAKDTLTIFSKELRVKGRVGQFLDERMDEGLMIYNVDMQGMQLTGEFKNFNFQYTLYGDLNNGIGLNIDDLEAFSLSRKFRDSLVVGASWVMAIPPYGLLKNNHTFNLFAGMPIKKGRVFLQIGYRPFDGWNFYSSNTGNKLACVIGVQKSGSTKRLEYSIAGSLRYYGFAYNLDHWDPNFRYRDPASDVYTMYANTVGKYLYPLRKFETEFSQWAVYTEYWGYDVAAANLTGNIKYQPVTKFGAFLDYDLNYIYGDKADFYSDRTFGTSSWLYPFFNAGIFYEPVENLQVKGAFANKAMNLDLHYPTHYLLRKPCFELSLAAAF